MRSVQTRVVDADDLAALRQPRDDVLVAEEAAGDGRFAMRHGPFSTYERTVEAEPDGERWRVTQTWDWRLSIPFFAWVFALPVRAALRRPPARSHWWAPPDRFDVRTASVVGLLCAASLISGYGNTLITQTLAFAAVEFDSDDSAQGVALAVVRVGIVIAVALVALADRRGRRALVVGTAFGAPVLAALGALAPSLPWLTSTQVVARPVATALGIVVGIVAVEEVPKNSRAFAVSLLAMTTALGAGLCVLALPLADLGEWGWRLVYVIPLAGLAIALVVRRRLPESRRFSGHRDVVMTGHGRRFWLLGVSGLLANIFVAPSSGFRNRYLLTERGFSGLSVSGFTVATTIPGAVGIVAGGRLADRRGRRVVGAVASVVGSLCLAGSFLIGGPSMWILATVGSLVGAAAVPALAVYGPELFPTGLRGKANGMIFGLSLAGSVVGLLVVGWVGDSLGRLGPIVAALAVGPVIVAALVITVYPETAHLTLEEINPEDADPEDDRPDDDRPDEPG